MAARDELLKLLPFKANPYRLKQEIFSEEVRDLSEKTSINYILQTPSKPVQYEILKKFFTRILEKVALIYTDQHQDGSITDDNLRNRLKRKYILTDFNLRTCFNHCYYCRNDEKNGWQISDLLYEEVPCPPKEFKYSRSNNRSTQVENVEKSLHYLNYKAQEFDLRKALRQPSQCMIFSVIAPNIITQKWVVHRLITKVSKQFKNSRNPFYIDLDETLIGNDYHVFLKKLSDHIGVKVDQVLEEICNSNSLTILIIHQFRQFKDIQVRIFQELEKTFDRQVLNLEQPRIIIFWLDECRPCFLLNRESEINIDICELAGLERIDEGDIEDWVNDHEDFYPFLTNLRGQTLGRQDWEWRDPRLILNRICCELQVKDGMAEIEKIWKWNNAK